MRTGVLALAAATTLFVISGCSDDETAWIVLEFKAQNGNKAEMAFDTWETLCPNWGPLSVRSHRRAISAPYFFFIA